MTLEFKERCTSGIDARHSRVESCNEWVKVRAGPSVAHRDVRDRITRAVNLMARAGMVSIQSLSAVIQINHPTIPSTYPSDTA